MFENGDRVKVVSDINFGSNLESGDTGTVVNSGGRFTTFVRFDRFINGHTCKGQCEEGYGWACYNESLKKIEQPESEA